MNKTKLAQTAKKLAARGKGILAYNVSHGLGNQCYKAVAMATKNPVLCDKMQGQYIQFDIDDCKRYIRETSN